MLDGRGGQGEPSEGGVQGTTSGQETRFKRRARASAGIRRYESSLHTVSEAGREGTHSMGAPSRRPVTPNERTSLCARRAHDLPCCACTSAADRSSLTTSASPKRCRACLGVGDARGRAADDPRPLLLAADAPAAACPTHSILQASCVLPSMEQTMFVNNLSRQWTLTPRPKQYRLGDPEASLSNTV